MRLTFHSDSAQIYFSGIFERAWGKNHTKSIIFRVLLHPLKITFVVLNEKCVKNNSENSELMEGKKFIVKSQSNIKFLNVFTMISHTKM